MHQIESSGWTPEELLEFDEWCDEAEKAQPEDSAFDAREFFRSVANPKMRHALVQEFARNLGESSGGTRQQDNDDTLSSLSPTLALKPGTKVDCFELVEMVGRGATAAVWKARHLDLDRDVALKFPTVFTAEIADRLVRESKAVAKLRHPNIAAIHEIRTDGDQGYLVTEFIDGVSLKEYLKRHPDMSLDRRLELLIQITEAISYSHSMGVVHRDIKPQNILIDQNHVPYVVDFGLARILNNEQIDLTNKGDIIGTPGYMSPEQANGEQNVNESVDIYSIGVLMYRLFTGRLPFSGNIQSVIYQIINENPPAPRSLQASLPKDLETICLKCLAKSPSERFSSAQELAFELRRFQNGEPIVSRPVPRIEKLMRWSRRKPLEATLVGLLVVCVGVLLAGAIVFGIKMQRARDQEIRLRMSAVSSEKTALKLKQQVELALRDSLLQKEIAELRARESKSSVELLKSVFQESDPLMWVLRGDGIGSGKPPSLQELFKNASVRIETDFQGDDQAKAALLETLGDSCRSLGFFPLSRQLLTSAMECRKRQIRSRKVRKNRSRLTSCQFDLLKIHFYFARLSHDCGEFDKAAEEYRACLAGIQKFETTMSSSATNLKAELLFHLGRLHLSERRGGEAVECFQSATAAMKLLKQPNRFLLRACELGVEFSELKDGEIPSTAEMADLFKYDSWAQRVVLQFTKVLKHRAKKDFRSAGDQYKRTLETLRERLPEDHPYYLLALGDFAGVQWRAGYYDDANKAIKIAIASGEKIAPDHPKLIAAQLHVGQELVRNGNLKEGIHYLEKAIKSYRKIHEGRKVSSDLWLELAFRYIETGQLRKARSLVNELKPWLRKGGIELAWWSYLDSKAFQKADPQRAKRSQAHVLKFIQNQSKCPENGIWCERMALVLSENGLLNKAIEYSQASIKFDAERFKMDHPRVANRRAFLGKLLLKAGRTNDAKQEFSESLRIRRKFFDSSNPLISKLTTQIESM